MTPPDADIKVNHTLDATNWFSPHLWPAACRLHSSTECYAYSTEAKWPGWLQCSLNLPIFNQSCTPKKKMADISRKWLSCPESSADFCQWEQDFANIWSFSFLQVRMTYQMLTPSKTRQTFQQQSTGACRFLPAPMYMKRKMNMQRNKNTLLGFPCLTIKRAPCLQPLLLHSKPKRQIAVCLCLQLSWHSVTTEVVL